MIFADEAKEIPSIPHDLAAETQLIGWVMANEAGDRKLLPQILYLSADAFHDQVHAHLWTVIKFLANKGEAISPYTLKPLVNWDNQAGDLLQYLSVCISQSLLMQRPIEGAKYLEELHQKRIMLSGLSSINAEASITENLGRLNQLITLVSSTNANNDFEDNLTVADKIIKDMRDQKKPFSTGLNRLDQAMDGGLYEGKSYGFAARKKVGKTAFAATVSANLNQAGVKHLFICGEMSPTEIHQRVLARMANIFPSSFRSGFGESDVCHNKLTQAIQKMPRNTLYKNAPGLTFDGLRHICTIAVEKHRVKGIILDYWQLVGGKAKNKSTAEHLDEVAQWIADFGRSYNLWTITMAQINQEGNTRGGEGIRLAFDQLYEIHRENLSKPEAWLEMMETRYTQWMNIGDDMNAGYLMNEKGPYYEEVRR